MITFKVLWSHAMRSSQNCSPKAPFLILKNKVMGQWANDVTGGSKHNYVEGNDDDTPCLSWMHSGEMLKKIERSKS